MNADTDTGDDGFEAVECSDTAERNWLSRAHTMPTYGPVAAWNRGFELPEGHGLECEEARYHPPTHTVLLVDDRPDEGRTIVTTFDADNLTDDAEDALRHLIRTTLPR